MSSPSLSQGLAIAGSLSAWRAQGFGFCPRASSSRVRRLAGSAPTDPNDPMAFEPVVSKAKPGWYT